MVLMLAGIWLAAAHPTVDRASHYVEMIWAQLPELLCTERIDQTRRDDTGKIRDRRERSYDYVLFLKKSGTSLVAEESRVVQRDAKQPDDAFLASGGFPSLVFLFHPAFIDRFEFDDPVRVPDGTVSVRFRSKTNQTAMAAVKLRGRAYPIHWQGTAWIDEVSGAVARIEADLADVAEVAPLGIHELHADIRYGAVVMPQLSRSLNLPLRANIRLTSARQRWENTHEYSNYRRFSVTTSTRPPGVR
jgi:hypothetical protein